MTEIHVGPESHEQVPVTWQDMQAAFNTFKYDLHLVHNPLTPLINPFSGTLLPDEQRNRQYNLTGIQAMTEEQFLEQYSRRNRIKIGCIDKDASGPFYENLTSEEQNNLTQILIAGGGVQLTAERLTALQTILSYLSQHGDHIEEVLFTGHDHTCGYIKSVLEHPLSEEIGCEVASRTEIQAMYDILYRLGELSQVELLFPNSVTFAVEHIDRNGNVELFTDLQPNGLYQELTARVPILS